MHSSKSSATESLKRIISDHGEGFSKSTEPRCFRLRSAKWFIIATVLLGIYVDIFLYGGTVVIIPFLLQGQIDIDSRQVLKWNSYSLLAYSAAAMLSSPVAGFLADKSSRRQAPLTAGLLFLFSGTITLWLAKSGAVLLAGRIFQGISCGFIWSIGLALIVDTVGKKNVGQVLALADIALCLGIATSPPIAGALLQVSGKHAVYGLAMGLIVMDVAMRVLMIEPRVAEKWLPKMDSESTTSGSLGTEAGEPIQENEVVEDAREVHEAISVDDTMYWKVLIKSWRIRGALCGTWGVAHILISIDATFPIWAEHTFAWGPEKVGLFLLAFYGPSLLCILTGSLADRYGSRWLTVAGFGGCIPFFLMMGLYVYVPPHLFEPFVCITMLGGGVSLAFANTPVMAEVIYAVMAKQERYPCLAKNSGGYGLAYGMFMTMFSFGSLTASTISPIILEKWNWTGLILSLVVCCIVSMIPVALWTGDKGETNRFLSKKAISSRWKKWTKGGQAADIHELQAMT